MSQDNVKNAIKDISLTLMVINDMVQPFHDWLAGEHNYFLGLGYTPEQSRAMAAATYTTVFGVNISGKPTP